MGIIVYSLLWVMRDLYHNPKFSGFYDDLGSAVQGFGAGVQPEPCYIYALGSVPPPPPTPPWPPWPPPPPLPQARAAARTCPCCRLGHSGICAAVVSRTRHELQLLNHEGCMAMVMVAAVL